MIRYVYTSKRKDDFVIFNLFGGMDMIYKRQYMHHIVYEISTTYEFKFNKICIIMI